MKNWLGCLYFDEMRNVRFLEVPSELGAGTRGASLGIDAIKVAAANHGSDLFLKFPQVLIETSNYPLFEPFEFETAKYVRPLSELYDKVCNEVQGMLENGVFPFIISGDHSCAGGTIAGIKKAYPEKRLGVIWIDAHADLHSPYTTPSGNMHGMPLATALAEDNRSAQRNNPAPEAVQYWNRLKETGGISPKIAGKDVVLIGVRDTEPEEDQLIYRLGIRQVEVADVRQLGVPRVLEEVRESLHSCDLIYVSFDVDSLDSTSLYSGTGTPVPGGLLPREAEQLLVSLAQWDRLCALEVVEVNPTLDRGNQMADTAFRLVDAVVRRL